MKESDNEKVSDDATQTVQLTAPQAVELLLAHVEAQKHERQLATDAGKIFTPKTEQKAERDRLLRQVLASLNCTRAELLTKLDVDRGTWDRWRVMTTIPKQVHLDALVQLATGKNLVSISSSRPEPLDMLSVDTRDRTWARLRLVYTLFPWENAIFWFRTAFSDEDTVVEMAMLTLREKSCRIIYMLNEPIEWGQAYIKMLKKSLGQEDAARVLSRICSIEVPGKLASLMPAEGYGLFNYEVGDQKQRVGYLWLLKDHDKPEGDKPQVYDPFSYKSQQFGNLKNHFQTALELAFKEIESRQISDFWQATFTATELDKMLRIPIVKSSFKDIDYITLEPVAALGESIEGENIHPETSPKSEP